MQPLEMKTIERAWKGFVFTTFAVCGDCGQGCNYVLISSLLLETII